jgi:hypothetical protein
VIHYIDDNQIAETPVVQGRSWCHDQFCLMNPTGDTNDIPWNTLRRADRQIASEVDHDVLALLRQIIVGSRREIENYASVSFMGTDVYWHILLAVGEGRDGREDQQADEQAGRVSCSYPASPPRRGGRSMPHSKLANNLSMSDWSIATAGCCGPFSSAASAAAPANSSNVSRSPLPNVATIWTTLASIVFSVPTTLAGR